MENAISERIPTHFSIVNLAFYIHIDSPTYNFLVALSSMTFELRYCMQHKTINDKSNAVSCKEWENRFLINNFMLIYLYFSLTFTEVHNSYIIIILKSLALRCLVMKLGYTSFLRVKLRCIESNYLRNICLLGEVTADVLTPWRPRADCRRSQWRVS